MTSHQVFVNGKPITVDPARSVGKGGEADVFDIGNGQALKLFKPPNHPDLQGCPAEQSAARDRLQEHQYKLRVFPPSLPIRVISPQHLATDRAGRNVLGYTMTYLQGAVPLNRYADRQFRQHGIQAQTVVEIFRDLHDTVSQLHQQQVVIGDFNDLNILIKDNKAHLIDADSYQFGSFLCRMYTTPFLDPVLCDPQERSPVLGKPYTAVSDWYAFTVMLMQCLLFVSPYGGVYRPKDLAEKIPHAARPLHRITVFHPEVRYPKSALSYDSLPDDLLHYFHRVFEKDMRGPFPLQLLHLCRWTTCTLCGREHARSTCPHCLKSGVVTQLITIRGAVTSTHVFTTPGIILTSTFQHGKLLWLYHEHGAFYREDREQCLQGDLDPHYRFGLRTKQTLIGKADQVILLQSDRTPERIAVDSYRSRPMFDVNAQTYYWLHNGQLLRQGEWGSNIIGEILCGQTRFWVGSDFGFGFYQAGVITVAFVFDAHRAGLNDRVTLPQWSGQLVDADCYFSADHCWLFLSLQEQGCLIHRCVVIRMDGQVIGTAQCVQGDGSWLGSLSGKCAVARFLLVATDEGILRVEPDQGGLAVTKTFPDTEPFVDHSCQLWAAAEGVYIVKRNEIGLIQIR